MKLIGLKKEKLPSIKLIVLEGWARSKNPVGHVGAFEPVLRLPLCSF